MADEKVFACVETIKHDRLIGVPEADDKGVVSADIGHLDPRPTQDPNDPLNWSVMDKYTTYLTVCFGTTLSTINASNLTVATVPLLKEFGQSTTRTAYLVCFNVLMLGLGNALWMPLSRVLGKRPVYILALLVLTVTNVWSALAGSFGSLLAARTLSGVGGAAFDATVPALVADLFFVHERGATMVVFHVLMSAGIYLGPLICGYAIQFATWRWTCGLLAMASGATLLLGLATIRESNYAPRTHAALDFAKPASFYPPAASLRNRLSLRHGHDPRQSMFATFGAIFAMALYPPVVWTGLTIGAFVGWNIVIMFTAAQTFTRPPYRWTLGSLGLLSVAGFLGALLAFLLAGRLIDLIAARMTLRNGHAGRQPEFRLPALVIPALVGPAGVLVFGFCVAHHASWVGAAVGYAMEGFGLTAVANVLVTYSVDAYPELAGEALVVIFCIRNAVACVLAVYTTAWEKTRGVQITFGEMVGIQYAILLLAVPMCVFGRKIRAWTMSFGPMKGREVEI